MNDINKWFYSLTLNELQQYIVKLEFENERLVKELNSSSKMNSLLENIVKSTQTGYSLLRRIEINKNCECNEHRNQELRKALNQSISETNLLLNHLHQFLSLKDSDNSTHGSDKDDVVDITDESDESPIPMSIRQTSLEKDSSASSSSPTSSGYDSMDFSVTATEKPVFDRVSDLSFHSEYTPIERQTDRQTDRQTESLSSGKQTEEMPQNLSIQSKPRSPQRSSQYNQTTSPTGVEHSSGSPSTSMSSSMTTSMASITFATSGVSLDKSKHLPNKCTECDLSFNLKPSLEQHLLTHINTTFTV